jgi:hypothetical protein
MASNIPGGTTATVTSNITGTVTITPRICVRAELKKMCVDPSKNCNCDAIVPVDLVDEGNIGKQNRIYFIERVSNMFWILNR